MNNTYFLARHGQTLYNAKKKNLIYPWPEPSPIGLTLIGRRQVKKAAQKLKKEHIDAGYSSDVFRARQTVKILKDILGLKIKFDPRLREINCGIFRGGPVSEYNKFFSSLQEKFTKRPPRGENWNDIKLRLNDFLKEVEKKHKNQKILVISHGDPLFLLSGILRRLTSEQIIKRKKELYLDVGQFRKIQR